jgi:hypothetical protein
MSLSDNTSILRQAQDDQFSLLGVFRLFRVLRVPVSNPLLEVFGYDIDDLTAFDEFIQGCIDFFFVG